MVDFAQMFGLVKPELQENQERENLSFCDKLKDAMWGMVFGFLLFFGCLGLSGWNEFRNVANQKTINAARDDWVQGSCSPIMSNLEGELVHITCPVTNLDVLGERDDVLQGIPQEARRGLSLSSYMETYQWNERSTTTTQENTVGGGSTKTTTYSYTRLWSSWNPPQVSEFFNQGDICKRDNNNDACLNWDPSRVEPWWQSSLYALGTKRIDESANAKAGDYLIPKDKLGRLGDSKILTPACSENSNSNNSSSPSNLLSCSPGGDALLKGTKMYWQQKDSDGKMVDYMTRSYTLRTTEMVSILAQQKKDSFVSWTSPYDDDYYVYEVVDGNFTATQMLDDLEASNVNTTWLLRFLSLAGCILGLVLITAPLTTIPDVIPVVGPLMGDMIGAILWGVNCMFGCCCWSFVTAIAWITYRPIVGIPLLCVSICLCSGAGFLMNKNHNVKQTRLKAEAAMAAAKEKENDEEEGDVEVAEEYDPDVPEQAGTEPEKE